MQIVLKLNEDKSISRTKLSNIFVGENEADTILLLFPQYLGGIFLKDKIITLHYINAENQGNVIKITFLDELYKEEFLQNIISIKSELTAVVGNLQIWFEISDTENNLLCKTNIITLTVNPHKDSAEFVPIETPQIFQEYKIQMQQLINSATIIKGEILDIEKSVNEKLQLMLDMMEEWEKNYGH